MISHAEWLAGLLAGLEHSGTQAAAAALYLRRHSVRLSLRKQSSGARWRIGNRVELNPRFLEGPPDAPYPISLVIHEVRHLQQGPVTALSVFGELDAWRAQFTYIKGRIGQFHELADKDQTISELMTLPTGWDRAGLSAARRLMREFAGPRYRIDLLPLYPLDRELVWALIHTIPKGGARH